MVIFTFKLNLTLKFKVNYPLKTIGTLIKVFCSSGPNLNIAWTGDKLSRRQANDYRTHRHTDRQTQPTTIPEGQNRPRVKIEELLSSMSASVVRPGMYQEMIVVTKIDKFCIFSVTDFAKLSTSHLTYKQLFFNNLPNSYVLCCHVNEGSH